MRLPTPSSCLLDGVEGDVYGFDKTFFCAWAALLFLVCYCGASWFTFATPWLRRICARRGSRAPLHAVRTAAVSCREPFDFSLCNTKDSLPALHSTQQ